MVWRILLVLLKSALMVALLELFTPVAEAIGLHFAILSTAAGAISHATGMPYGEAETLFLFLLATTLLEIGRFVCELVAG